MSVLQSNKQSLTFTTLLPSSPSSESLPIVTIVGPVVRIQLSRRVHDALSGEVQDLGSEKREEKKMSTKFKLAQSRSVLNKCVTMKRINRQTKTKQFKQ